MYITESFFSICNLAYHLAQTRQWFYCLSFQGFWYPIDFTGFSSYASAISRCQCMRLKPLFTIDINRKHLAETSLTYPWGLGIRIPAADGLSKVLPVHISRYYLWDNSELMSAFHCCPVNFAELSTGLTLCG